MKKFLILMAFLLPAIIPLRAETPTYTLELSSSTKFTSASTPITQDGVSWTCTSVHYQNTYSPGYGGQQFGTSSVSASPVFTSDGITGTITKVVVYCNTGGTGTVGVKVGGSTFGGDPQSITKNTSKVQVHTFTAEATGEVEVTLTRTGSSAMYLGKIEVYTNTGSNPVVLNAPTISCENNTVTITPASGTPNTATISYSYDGGLTWNNYSEPFAITESHANVTIKVEASGYTTYTGSNFNFTYTAPAASTEKKVFVANYNGEYFALSTETGTLDTALKAVKISGFNTSGNKAQISADQVATLVWDIYPDRHIKNGDKYLSATTGGNLKWNTTSTTLWSEDANGYWRMDGSTDRAILMQNSSLNVKNYSTKNGHSGYTKMVPFYYEIVAAKVATPVIAPESASILTSQTITITCATEGATIYYTTDGTAPTTSSSIYTAPFTLGAGEKTVNAIAAKADMTNSDVATRTYTVSMPAIAAPTVSVTDNVVTITSTPNDAVISYSYDGGSTWITYSEPFAITESHANVTIKVEASGYTTYTGSNFNFTYTSTTNPAAGTYQLVTSDNIVVGGKYLIVSTDGETNYAMGFTKAANETSESQRNAVPVTVADDKVVILENQASLAVCPVEIGESGTEGKYTLKYTAGSSEYYLSFNGTSGSKLKGVLTAAISNNEKFQFTFDANANTWKIYNQARGRHLIFRGNTYNVFGNYSNSGNDEYIAPKLYKLMTEDDYVISAATVSVDPVTHELSITSNAPANATVKYSYTSATAGYSIYDASAKPYVMKSGEFNVWVKIEADGYSYATDGYTEHALEINYTYNLSSGSMTSTAGNTYDFGATNFGNAEGTTITDQTFAADGSTLTIEAATNGSSYSQYYLNVANGKAVSIDAPNGKKISKVTVYFYETGTSTRYNRLIAESSYESNTNAVYTVIPTDNVASLTLTSVGGVSRIIGINVETADCTWLDTPKEITIDASNIVTISQKDSSNATSANSKLQYSLDNGTTWVDYTTPFRIWKSETVVARNLSISDDALTSATISQTVEYSNPAATAGTYAKVTNASKLAEGKHVVIANISGSKVMSTSIESYLAAPATTGCTWADEKVTVATGSDANTFTLVKSGDNWRLRNNADQYLIVDLTTTNKNRLGLSYDPTFADCSITFNANGNAIVVFKATIDGTDKESNELRYNATADKFAANTGSGYGANTLQLMMVESEIPTTSVYNFHWGNASGSEWTDVQFAPSADYSTYTIDGTNIIVVPADGDTYKFVIHETYEGQTGEVLYGAQSETTIDADHLTVDLYNGDDKKDIVLSAGRWEVTLNHAASPKTLTFTKLAEAPAAPKFYQGDEYPNGTEVIGDALTTPTTGLFYFLSEPGTNLVLTATPSDGVYFTDEELNDYEIGNFAYVDFSGNTTLTAKAVRTSDGMESEVRTIVITVPTTVVGGSDVVCFDSDDDHDSATQYGATEPYAGSSMYIYPYSSVAGSTFDVTITPANMGEWDAELGVIAVEGPCQITAYVIYPGHNPCATPITLTITGALDDSDTEVVYRLVKKGDTIIAPVINNTLDPANNHNTYILVNQDIAELSDAAMTTLGAMGGVNSSNTTKRDFVTDFATLDDNKDLILKSSPTHVYIYKHPTDDKYALYIEDRGYLKSRVYDENTGTYSDKGMYYTYDSSDSEIWMTLEIIQKKYLSDDAEANVMRNKFYDSTFAFGYNKSSGEYNCYSYTTVNSVGLNGSHRFPALYRRVEAGEATMPGDIILKVKNDGDADASVTSDRLFNPMPTTSELIFQMDDDDWVSDDITFAVTSEPAAGVTITYYDAYDEVCEANDEAVYYAKATFADVNAGEYILTATVSRPDPLLSTTLTQTTSVKATFVGLDAPKFFSGDTDITASRMIVGMDENVTLKNTDANGTLRYEYRLLGSTSVDPDGHGSIAAGNNAVIPVSTTTYVEVWVEAAGYITFHDTFTLLPTEVKEDELTYSNFVPKKDETPDNGYQLAKIVTGTSGNVYSGKVNTNKNVNNEPNKHEVIQINKYLGWIYNKESEGILTSVTFTLNEIATTGRSFSFYGSNTPFPTDFVPSDANLSNYTLMNNNNQKETYKYAEGSNVVTFDFDEDKQYPYFILITSGATYLDGINFTIIKQPDTAARRPEIVVMGKQTTGTDYVPFEEGEYDETADVFHTGPIVVKVKQNSKFDGESVTQQVSYSTDSGSSWSSPADEYALVVINNPLTLLAKAHAAGLDDSSIVSKGFVFAPAVPGLSSQSITVDEAEQRKVTITKPSGMTPNTMVLYRINDADEWTEITEWNASEGTAFEFNWSDYGTTHVEAKAYNEIWGTESATVHTTFIINDPALNVAYSLVSDVSTLLPGDEIILVYSGNSFKNEGETAVTVTGKAMKPYVKSANNLGSTDVNIDIPAGGAAPTIMIAPTDESVERLTLEKGQDSDNNEYWRFRTQVYRVNGEDAYLKSTGSNTDKTTNNHLKAQKLSDNLGKELATIAINADANNSHSNATIVFVKNAGNSNILRYNTTGGLFSCYSVGQQDVMIFRRGETARAARPVPVDENGEQFNENYFMAEDVAGKHLKLSYNGPLPEGKTADDVDIYYTTDGSDPHDNGEIFDMNGQGLSIDDCLVVRAYVDIDGMLPSYEMILAYHVYTGDKKFRRVQAREIQTLQPGEEVVILAAHEIEEGEETKYDFYALGRNQKQNEENADLNYRAAVKLTGAGVPDANGIMTLNNTEVQPLVLISGAEDTYPDYDWRLYASGTYFDDDLSDVTDGYLFSGGDNHSLTTRRITDRTADELANADVKLLSKAVDRVGNDFGGVTVKFGSPDGNEENYPNYMGLSNDHGVFSFGVYTKDQVIDDAAYDDNVYCVSLYRVFDPSKMLAPVANYSGGMIASNWDLTLSNSESNAVIWYALGEITKDSSNNDVMPTMPAIDDTSSWTLFEGTPIDFSSYSDFVLWAYASDVAGQRKDSDVNTQIYNVELYEIYELVTTGTPLNQQDRLIIVNNLPYPDFAETGYYAMTYNRYKTYGDAWHILGREVREMASIEEDAPRQLLVPVEEDIAVFTLEPAGSVNGTVDPFYRYMLRLDMPEAVASVTKPTSTKPAELDDLTDEQRANEVSTYLTANAPRQVTYRTTLPPMSERHTINAGVQVVDAPIATTPGDYIYYAPHDLDDGTHLKKTETGDVMNKAVVVFKGKEPKTNENGQYLDASDNIVTNAEDAEQIDKYYTIRFQPDGNYRHFNCYYYTYDEVTGNNIPNASTYPISIYRATGNVLTPSMTIYEKDNTGTNKTNPDAFENVGVSSSVTTFNNPIKIVVKDNPRSSRETKKSYAWAPTNTQTPVSDEYEKNLVKDETTVTFILDGFKATLIRNNVNGNPGEVRTTYDMRSYDWTVNNVTTPMNFVNHTQAMTDLAAETGVDTEWLESTFFAMAYRVDPLTQETTHSRPAVRDIHFQTLPPAVERDGNEAVLIQRPTDFTLGAVVVYTLDGTLPTVRYEEDGTITALNGWIIPVDDNPSTTDVVENRIEVDSGEKLILGAFKEGYEPSYTEFKQYSYYPLASPLQMLEATTAGKAAIRPLVEASLNASPEVADSRVEEVLATFDNAKKIYLTYNSEAATGHSLKHYVGWYRGTKGQDDYEFVIVNVNDDDIESKVLNQPGMAKWSADYYVVAMVEEEFKQVVGTNYQNLEVTVSDPANPNVPAMRSPILNTDGNVMHLWGGIIERHGSLGLNYLSANLGYDVPVEGGEPDHYDTSNTRRILPSMPLPKNLGRTFVTSRDDADDYIVTKDQEIITHSSANGRSSEEVIVKFRKEEFTLRHFDCEFSFDRPDVTADIVDNYDIVYDIIVTSTDRDVEDIHKLYSDPVHSDSPLYNSDGQHEYKFVVKDVIPTEAYYPTIKINHVYYIPNGENDGYAQLDANYPKAADLAADQALPEAQQKFKQFLQEIEGENSVRPAANYAPNFELGYFGPGEVPNGWNENGDVVTCHDSYVWGIKSHSEFTNPDVDLDNDGATPQLKMGAPFMYHVEAYIKDDPGLTNRDAFVQNGEFNDMYYSHEYLVSHNEGHDTGKGNDPFDKFVLGAGFTKQMMGNWIVQDGKEVLDASTANYPTVVVTPIYFFARDMQTSVSEEGALEVYSETVTNPGQPVTQAPRRRAGGSSTEGTENSDGTNTAGNTTYGYTAPNGKSYVVIRGTSMEHRMDNQEGVVTDVDVVRADNSDALYFNIQGIRVDAENITPGVYIRVAGGVAEKILVK